MTEGLRIELCNCTQVLLDEIAMKDSRRIDIAQTYALALRSSTPTDWKRVNEAIIARWSASALRWIKDRAWSGKAFEKEATRD